MRFFITGTAGFIGFHLARRLLDDGHFVTGFDGFTPYYSVQLKQARHAILKRSNGFRECIAPLEDQAALRAAAADAAPDVIVHLAAQAGVRYSLENPKAYVDSNLIGTFHILELARELKPAHLLLASTSSVYGANEQTPFKETDKADTPITLYAATKKAMEAMSHSYAHLWQIPTTCFRFFTVYGPWGRPDMALFKFAELIERGQPIDVYGNGRLVRDFTYIDDLIECIVRLIDRIPQNGAAVAASIDTLSAVAPWRVVNIGGGQPVELMTFIRSLECALGTQAQLNMLPPQMGDMTTTDADHALLEALIGFKPSTPLDDGIAKFVAWYRDDYRRIARDQ